MTTKNRTPKIGRAALAVAGGDWAILPQTLQSIIEIVTRTNDLEAFAAPASEQAVQAEFGEPLENTRRATVRNGVAIIPIRGSIMRFGSWYSDYLGCTSVETIAKDFHAALRNPNVFSILFVVHSPGGEVTGINELSDMIYNARGRKPITAYVEGLGCSAAYWLSSAAGDVVCDETAQLGSIGVMTVYTDDTKWQEKVGIEDIELISDQSPYKNLPPTTDEGRKRVVARLTALCQVFGEKVARNRDVSVETVWKDFGKGDVLVGANAVKAGLADRLGSFEETLQELAEAHTPGFQKPLDSAADLLSTFNSESNLGSQISTPEPDKTVSAQEETGDVAENNGDNDPEENSQTNSEEIMNTQNSGVITAETDNKPDAPQAQEQQAAPQTAAAVPIGETAQQVADLQRRLAEANALLAAKNEEIARAAADALDKRIKDIAAGLPGEIAEQESFLKDLAKAFGEDSPQFKSYVEQQTALKNQIDTGALFSEAGVSGASANSADDPLGKLNAIAARIAKERNISTQQAFSIACDENPNLYETYRNGK